LPAVDVLADPVPADPVPDDLVLGADLLADDLPTFGATGTPAAGAVSL
jgi:hypothetical protein